MSNFILDQTKLSRVGTVVNRTLLSFHLKLRLHFLKSEPSSIYKMKCPIRNGTLKSFVFSRLNEIFMICGLSVS